MNHDQLVIFLIVFCSIAFAVIAMQTYFDARRNQQKKRQSSRHNSGPIRRLSAKCGCWSKS